jgi:predicted unusual protein kinase regulating ubiquinone biosynthesis (AarF/ABC1/UbiB family)
MVELYEFFFGAWFVIYSSGIICTEYAKYKCKCWAGSIYRSAVSILRETRSESAAGEDAAANYESECFNSMIKQIGTKLAGTNVYYIKLFQAVAYHTDITNSDLDAFLRDYTDRVAFTGAEYSVSDLVALSDYARSIGYTLSLDPAEPVKSGSVSLVFYGKLTSTLESAQHAPESRSIVVKYLRANMERRVLDSIRDFKYLIMCLNRIPSLKYLHLTDIYNEQRVLMMDQIDFAKEAACIAEVYDNCRETRCIKVPFVYPEFTEKFPNIIVMERLIGKTLNQLNDNVKDHFCHSLARGLVKTVFIDGLYHCDLHPGNALFIEEKSSEANINYRVGVLDFGIIGRISVDERDLTYQLFHSIINKDGDGVLASLMESYTEPCNASLAHDKADPVMLDDMRRYICNVVNTSVTCFTAENLCVLNKLLIKNNLKIARSFTKFELALSVSDNMCKKLTVKHSYLNHLSDIIGETFE